MSSEVIIIVLKGLVVVGLVWLAFEVLSKRKRSD